MKKDWVDNWYTDWPTVQLYFVEGEHLDVVENDPDEQLPLVPAEEIRRTYDRAYMAGWVEALDAAIDAVDQGGRAEKALRELLDQTRLS
jgi:hypothetical protein